MSIRKNTPIGSILDEARAKLELRFDQIENEVLHKKQCRHCSVVPGEEFLEAHEFSERTTRKLAELDQRLSNLERRIAQSQASSSETR